MSFRLYCSGAEVGAHAKLLKAEGWNNVALSYWHLHPRMPKRVPWTVAERLAGCSVLLDSGGSAADKKGLTQGELADYVGALHQFTEANYEHLDLVVEFDALSLGPKWIEEQRKGFYSDLGDKFIPVWHGDLRELDRLAATYHRVGISEDALEEQTGLAMRVNSLVSQHGTEFHATASAKPDDLRSVRFATAATGSWLSPTRYGETIIWDGQKLHRYPARMKDKARRQQSSTITRAGFDAALIAADDNAELTRLTLWSLGRLEASVDSRRPDLALVADNEPDAPTATVVELHKPQPDSTPTGMRNPPVHRKPEDRAVLPVVSLESVSTSDTADDGTLTIGDRTVLKLNGTSLRQCDSCFVASSCPAFKPGHECAFGLPVSITTKDQLVSVLNAVIEMQTQRVMFGRFAEELAGGYPDANLSDEIDRLFKLVTSLKRMEDNQSFLRVSVEARGQAGVLSRIFGERAGQLNQLPNVIDADRVLDGALNGPLDS